MHVERIRGKKSERLKGKKIVLGVTGSIAAVETVKLARELIRRGAEVFAVMSKSARKIIHPYALEFATGNKVITEITGEVEHVKFLGKDGIADLFLIAPSTANTIGKIANGIDDTPVTTFATTALGARKPVLIAPAMHEAMIDNDLVIRNIEKLKGMGVEIIEPKLEEGKAKFPEIEKICLHVERALYPKEFAGKKVLVTAGPTFEHLDPIRFISNKSSGLMGKEIALELWRRGAEVVFISSKNLGISLPNFKQIEVRSVLDMLKAVLNEIKDCSLFVSAAAASDFLVEMEKKKIKTTKEITITLREAPKVIKEVRKIYSGDIIGFKAETGVSDEELERIARERLEADALSMVVANDVLERGMGTEDTRVVVVTEKRSEWFEGMKSEVARKIVERYLQDCV
ncbi:MAG: bifunctional phosphopantothenoylcysteine decarboxylase/phosphopantothenate--cysteine ligase CoaBC [Archaeoglobi archaeon]|nr:MAG: bifunctional phosphopantothenoylcysteine decarboxylase/phosphopantothenate--cysteine ligase CoaBC [Archaeoglobi archaeon]TDA29047.1 MAG: bifunctional phosphopantothenoylcysteine decarboxylase/phosphopantothenate--cysteine ligase CoaBC [Archaeoglobi archaeon]